MYPEYILRKLRLRCGRDEHDTSGDDYFNKLKKDVVLEEVLAWDGLGKGWKARIFGYIEGIYGINLNDMD